MLDHIAYMVALAAPDLAEATADAAGSMVENVGKRLAAGVHAKVCELVVGEGEELASLLANAGAMSTELPACAVRLLRVALLVEGLELAARDELVLLRELANQLREGRDCQATLRELNALHAGTRARQPTAT